ncbi:hypothetical protein ACJJTC_019503 [Scirpophaga incertulas]
MQLMKKFFLSKALLGTNKRTESDSELAEALSAVELVSMPIVLLNSFREFPPSKRQSRSWTAASITSRQHSASPRSKNAAGLFEAVRRSAAMAGVTCHLFTIE